MSREMSRGATFLWSDRLFGRYESYVSLDWKLAWLNPRQRRLVKERAEHRGITMDPHPTISVPYDGRGVQQIQSRARGALFDPGPLRYCPTCIQYGYISTYFQAVVLKRCPIHNEVLRSKCSCGEYLPVVRKLKIERPFCCPTCAASLAPNLQSKLMRAKAEIHEREAVYDALSTWVTRLDECPYLIEALDLRLRYGGSVKDSDRARAAATLLAVEPLSMPHGVLRDGFSFVRAELPELSTEGFRVDDWDKSPTRLRVIDRHIRRRLLRGLNLHSKYYCGRAARYCLTVPWLKPKQVHPLVHAYWRWRDQLEPVAHRVSENGRRRLLYDRPDARTFSDWTMASQTMHWHMMLGWFFECVRCTMVFVHRPRGLTGERARNVLRYVAASTYGFYVPNLPRKDRDKRAAGQRLVVITGRGALERKDGMLTLQDVEAIEEHDAT